MENANSRLKNMEKAIPVMGMALAVALDFNIRGMLHIPWIAIVLCASMIYLFLWFIDYSRKNIVMYLVIASMMVSGVVFLIWRKIDIVAHLIKLKNWFYKNQTIKEEYHITYAFAILFAVLFLATVIFYILHKNYKLWYAVLIGFMAFLAYSMINEVTVNKVSLATLLIFFIQMIVELSNRRHSMKKGRINQGVNLYMLPICILIGILAVGFPSNSKPIQWKTIKQFFLLISDKIDDLSFYFSSLGGNYNGEYSVSFAGYSDQDGGNLGGSIKESDQVIVKVEPKTKAYSKMYLVGNISDEYTSKGWKRSKINFFTSEEAIVDFYEMLYGMYQNQVLPKEDERLLHPMSLSIKYEKIRTKTIFYPIKIHELDIEKNKISYDKRNPSLLATSSLKRGFTYQLNYNEVNYGSETMEDYLRSISIINENQVESIPEIEFQIKEAKDYLKVTSGLFYFDPDILNTNFSNLLKQRSKVINQYYTKIPKQVPNRVYELVDQITKPYDNNYDKLKAIEEYLSGLLYTMTPSETKEGEDFVDYFLFQQKEGYCTYFATSMAIMARCIGIPTRYVEGVVVDYKTKEGKEYLVNSNDAHAWTEAYIEGFGWVPFEPTPKMYKGKYETWEKTNTTTNQIQPVPTPMIMGGNGIEVDLEGQKIEIRKEKNIAAQYILRICIIIVLVISMLLAGAFVLFYYNKKKKYRNASGEEKVTYLIQDILECLKLDHYYLQEAETLTDFACRLGDGYTYDEKSFEEVITIFLGLRYGEKKVKELELKSVEMYKIQLDNDMRKKWGWIRMLKYQISI